MEDSLLCPVTSQIKGYLFEVLLPEGLYRLSSQRRLGSITAVEAASVELDLFSFFVVPLASSVRDYL